VTCEKDLNFICILTLFTAMPMPGEASNANFVYTSPPPPYYAPPGPAVPPPPPGTTVTFIQRPVAVVAMGPHMGTESVALTCPSCRALVMTRTEAKITTRTHMFALVLCLLG
jgi:lipopolysaccharide-induced tumor necrosis factor-alpha factor